jgi:hypothetical protein
MSGLADPRDLVDRVSRDVLGIRPVIVSPPPPGWDPDDDPGPGTFAKPFHSITNGINASNGRRPVYLRGGHYIQNVDVTGIEGPEDRKCTITSVRGESVTIDCYDPAFLNPTEEAHWNTGDGPGEFIWSRSFPDGQREEVSRGAFLDTHQHTRLITYGHLEDLLATNEFAPRIEDHRPENEIDLDEPPPGDNRVWIVDPEDKGPPPKRMIATTEPREYRNWMYMGPGIWFNPKTRKLHIRLSHTRHGIPGWPAYTGITDPRQVRLALSKTFTPAVRLTNCKHLRFKGITIRFGGQDTLRIDNCENLEFDHVNIRAGTSAIRLEAGTDERNDRIVFHDCHIDGGIPTWYFRSDRKDEYNFVPATLHNATEKLVKLNPLGSATSNNLLSSRQNATGIEVHHCELVNGHDICLFGHGMRFHHNWVNNLNDDALFLGSEDADTCDAWIYRNVVTKVLTTLSFASKTPLGHIRIFRNLFDIREPTLGIRPRNDSDHPLFPLRQGQVYKSNGLEGPFDLWHNTCLVLNAGGSKVIGGRPTELGNAGFTHYKEFRSKEGQVAGQRRSYNNIFVAIYPDSGLTKAIAYLPPKDFQGPTDGNIYERIGPEDTVADPGDEPRFRVTDANPAEFATLVGYNNRHDPWERHGTQANPLFRSFDSISGLPDTDHDDLRPRRKTGTQPGSPASGTALEMPDDITDIDKEADVLAKNFGNDRGCYWSLQLPGFPLIGFKPFDRMSVGVDGRKKFPR